MCGSDLKRGLISALAVGDTFDQNGDEGSEVVYQAVGTLSAPDEQQRHGCHEPVCDPAAVGRRDLRVCRPRAEGGHGGKGTDHSIHIMYGFSQT